jgi:hypothetical protein
MAAIENWWDMLSPATRDWLIEHVRQRISWHILGELHTVGAEVSQPDKNRSIFDLSDTDWEFIEAQVHGPGSTR